jgi:hypothetical protein
MKEYRWFVDGREALDPPVPPDATGVVAIWNGTPGTTHSFVLEVLDQGGLSDKADCGSVAIPL